MSQMNKPIEKVKMVSPVELTEDSVYNEDNQQAFGLEERSSMHQAQL